MVTDSKILTVSYGTFSCTLEGFDDPFNTMRSIAEYFRDLAADDRYFGAEPPTPDPQMLQSIAEREIQRRVETKMEENGMILRQVEGAPNGDIAAPMAQPPATTAPIAKAPISKAPISKAPIAKAPISKAPAPQTRATAAPAAEFVAAPAEPMPQHATTPSAAAPAAAIAQGSIAEKLARIRAAVAKRDDAPFAEDQHAADAFGADENSNSVDDDIMGSFEADRLDVAPDTTAEIAAKPAIDTTAEIDTKAPDLPEADPTDMAQDSFEDEIDLTAVMEAADAQDAAEAQTVAPAIESTDDVAFDTLLDAADDQAADDTSDNFDIDTASITGRNTATELDDSASALHDIDPNLAADIAEASRAPEADEDDTATAPQDPLTRVRARVIKMRRADYEAEIAEQQNAQQAAADTDADEAENDTNADDTTQPLDINLEADPSTHDGASGVEQVAADEATDDDDDDDFVIDLAAFDEDDSADDEDLYIEDLDEADTGAADITSVLRRELGASSLSDDDEDDLMRELAEVAAESVDAEIVTDPIVAAPDEDAPDTETLDNVAALLGGDVVEDAPLVDDAFDANAGEDATQDREATRNIFSTSADDTMSRILDETEREMEKDDTSRRRSAIQHLKAAVMSKRADRDAGNADIDDDDEKNIYRNDLASIVRPKRPERVKTTRRDLPPLMLVSEQRIDTPKDVIKGADISPVRPRRISAAAVALREEADVDHDDAIANATGFTDYAETMGAQGLSDLLEAAAAYANHIEGKDTVSRPQIMRLAAEAMPDEQPLEERLRSFGQLLRQGKIKKIARGQFKVSDASRFKPATRAHG